jgi:hypothetical protein
MSYKYVQVFGTNPNYTAEGDNRIVQISIQSSPNTKAILSGKEVTIGRIGLLEYDNISIKNVSMKTEWGQFDILIYNPYEITTPDETVVNEENLGNINYINNFSLMTHKEDED